MDSLESFLRDLRALRERQGLSIDDLAARTHYPAETIAAAESGPARPTLPIVEAYVLACGSEPEHWEDRWRELRPDFVMTRLDPARSARRISLPWLVAAAAMVALVGGGSAALTLTSAGHDTPRAATPGQVTVTPGASPSSAAQAPPGASSPRPAGSTTPPPAPSLPAVPASSPPGTVTTPPARPSTVPATLTASTEVTGPGCPHGSGDGVMLDDAKSGPGWTTATGGWTGDGCDGSSVWTMDPSGKQTASSALTWFFTPAAADTSCTLSVFVPTKNANGVAYYAIGSGSASLGMVPVDQSADKGEWINLGTYQRTGSQVEIQLSPELATLTSSNGNGNGNGHSSAVAASAASAVCE